MSDKQKLVAALLIAAGVYSEANASVYASSLQPRRADMLIRTLSGCQVPESGGGVLMSGQGGGN